MELKDFGKKNYKKFNSLEVDRSYKEFSNFIYKFLEKYTDATDDNILHVYMDYWLHTIAYTKDEYETYKPKFEYISTLIRGKALNKDIETVLFTAMLKENANIFKTITFLMPNTSNIYYIKFKYPFEDNGEIRSELGKLVDKKLNNIVNYSKLTV